MTRNTKLILHLSDGAQQGTKLPEMSQKLYTCTYLSLYLFYFTILSLAHTRPIQRQQPSTVV
jgi:hypothetical protein